MLDSNFLWVLSFVLILLFVYTILQLIIFVIFHVIFNFIYKHNRKKNLLNSQHVKKVFLRSLVLKGLFLLIISVSIFNEPVFALDLFSNKLFFLVNICISGIGLFSVPYIAMFNIFGGKLSYIFMAITEFITIFLFNMLFYSAVTAAA